MSMPNARIFGRCSTRSRAGFVEPFLTAPSPGIVAAAMKNEYYDTKETYLEALAHALRVEYEAIVGHGFLMQLDSPDLALERHISYQDRSAGMGRVAEDVVWAKLEALAEGIASARLSPA